MSMDCKRFNNCNASLCPLGADASHTGHHAGGEPVCYYLRMSGKPGAADRFADDPAFASCLERLPVVVAEYPSIGKAIERASRTGFKGDNLTREPQETQPTDCAVRGCCPQQVL